MASNSKNDFRIIIVGAGPSGLLLALLLAKQGIKVTVLEKSHEFDRQPRASFYSSPAIHEMKRAGIMDDVYKKAYYATGVSWRHPDGTYICGIDDMKLPFEMRAVSLPLDQLIPLIAGHLAQCPCAEILLQHEVTGIGQDEREAWVQVQTPDGEKRLSATYVVGCDGGSSKVRRELFGSDFPGKTWDRQIVATNVYYPKFHDYKWQSSNFFISAEHHAMIAQLANDGLLRITYGEDGSLSREEMLARQPEKFKAFVPGAPEPTEYKVVNFSPYRIHQRCAERFRVGRFLLAADAAHLCNPYGGMGLTGGFADVGGLYDCLNAIYSGKSDDGILDKYDEVRRDKYWSIIDPISTRNLNRLMNDSPEAIRDDEFFNLLKKAEADQSGNMNRDMALGVKAVMHDFTKDLDDVVSR